MLAPHTQVYLMKADEHAGEEEDGAASFVSTHSVADHEGATGAQVGGLHGVILYVVMSTWSSDQTAFKLKMKLHVLRAYRVCSSSCLFLLRHPLCALNHAAHVPPWPPHLKSRLLSVSSSTLFSSNQSCTGGGAVGPRGPSVRCGSGAGSQAAGVGLHRRIPATLGAARLISKYCI